MNRRWTILVIIFLLILWISQKRSFFCLENGKCITVWKKFGGTCYIVPGKYYGITKPDQTYIVTTNVNILTFYWSGKMPNSYIVRNEGEDNFKIVNKGKSEFKLYNHAEDPKKFMSILYGENSKLFKDVKEDADFITVDIRYLDARNKNWEKL